jgi:cytoskeletal protein RodZ
MSNEPPIGPLILVVMAVLIVGVVFIVSNTYFPSRTPTPTPLPTISPTGEPTVQPTIEPTPEPTVDANITTTTPTAKPTNSGSVQDIAGGAIGKYFKF